MPDNRPALPDIQLPLPLKSHDCPQSGRSLTDHDVCTHRRRLPPRRLARQPASPLPQATASPPQTPAGPRHAGSLPLPPPPPPRPEGGVFATPAARTSSPCPLDPPPPPPPPCPEGGGVAAADASRSSSRVLDPPPPPPSPRPKLSGVAAAAASGSASRVLNPATPSPKRPETGNGRRLAFFRAG